MWHLINPPHKVHPNVSVAKDGYIKKRFGDIGRYHCDWHHAEAHFDTNAVGAKFCSDNGIRQEQDNLEKHVYMHVHCTIYFDGIQGIACEYNPRLHSMHDWYGRLILAQIVRVNSGDMKQEYLVRPTELESSILLVASI